MYSVSTFAENGIRGVAVFAVPFHLSSTLFLLDFGKQTKLLSVK